MRKRFDYFYARIAVEITTVPFVVLLIAKFIGFGNWREAHELALTATATGFFLAIVYVVTLVCANAYIEMEKGNKKYESMNQITLMSDMPFIVRFDGRSFHTFTRGLARPYDERLSKCMQKATIDMMNEFSGVVGYTQSNEISIIFRAEHLVFGGRRSKIESVMAAKLSVFFNRHVQEFLPEKANQFPVFDARAWQYPYPSLYAESLYWREMDATRNSLTMACHAHFSQKDLHKAGFKKKHDMLMSKGINWNDYPSHFKRGTYFVKASRSVEIDDITWNKIPEKHRPASKFAVRSTVEEMDYFRVSPDPSFMENDIIERIT